MPPEAQGGRHERARRVLARLHDAELNFDLDRADERTPENGWHVDDHRVDLPPERPGDPLAGGSWEVGVELLRAYEFADPAIVRTVYHGDEPFEQRTMLLEACFYGLRFLLGVRVGGVIDGVRSCDGRQVRVWGWNYRTLQGHLEMGQMDYEMWKWLDTGEIEFRIHGVSKPAVISNPVIRLGFSLFGRMMQQRFARRALERMNALVCETLVTRATEGPVVDGVDRTGDTLTVAPASGTPGMAERLRRSTPLDG